MCDVRSNSQDVECCSSSSIHIDAIAISARKFCTFTVSYASTTISTAMASVAWPGPCKAVRASGQCWWEALLLHPQSVAPEEKYGDRLLRSSERNTLIIAWRALVKTMSMISRVHSATRRKIGNFCFITASNGLVGTHAEYDSEINIDQSRPQNIRRDGNGMSRPSGPKNDTDMTP